MRDSRFEKTFSKTWDSRFDPSGLSGATGGFSEKWLLSDAVTPELRTGVWEERGEKKPPLQMNT